jgi:hypothetical protein
MTPTQALSYGHWKDRTAGLRFRGRHFFGLFDLDWDCVLDFDLVERVVVLMAHGMIVFVFGNHSFNV